jgi:WD40 repeat protein
MIMPTNTAGFVTSLCWHVNPTLPLSLQSLTREQPNDSLLAAGTLSGLTTIWNIDGSLRASMPSPHGPIFNLGFNPSGTCLTTCSANGVLEIYSTKDWSSMFNVPATGKPWEHTPNIPMLVWIDDQRLATLGPNTPHAVVNCWQFDESQATSLFLQLIGHEGLINDIQYDRPTGLIGTASDDASVRLWKLDKSSPHHEFKTHSNPVRSLSFRPSPQDDSPHILASASWDGTIHLYDITALTHLHTIGTQIHNFPHDRIACVSWAPDGRFFSSGDLEGVVGVWEWRDDGVGLPRAYAIWAPERIREDRQQGEAAAATANNSVGLANGANGHKDDHDRPVHGIHWQKNGQSFVICRENRKVCFPPPAPPPPADAATVSGTFYLPVFRSL